MDLIPDASVAAARVLEDEQNDLAGQVIDSLATQTAHRTKAGRWRRLS